MTILTDKKMTNDKIPSVEPIVLTPSVNVNQILETTAILRTGPRVLDHSPTYIGELL